MAVGKCPYKNYQYYRIVNKPMCYIDEKGKPAGIFVEVLEYAARMEG